MNAASSGPITALATAGRAIICAGPGGVGKTTCAAAIALRAARMGRRACVVTIDPAKRLADALGLETLTNDPRRIEVEGMPGAGELWALMLDTKSTFDDVVQTNAASPEQAAAILDNKLYRNISSALGGTQEYMAMEKLYALQASGRFDLLVIDTPPTRHALDFLDAPSRLLRFLDNRIFRLLMTPTRAVGIATQMFLRTLSRVVGAAVVADAIAFFTAFEGMEQGFRDRAARVQALLSDPATSFVLVAAPRREVVAEAGYFADRLSESGGQIGALVVNRMFPAFGPVPEQLAAAAAAPGVQPQLAALAANMVEIERVSRCEEAHVADLSSRLAGPPVVRVPFLSSDVHDIPGLDRIGTWIFDGHDVPELGLSETG